VPEGKDTDLRNAIGDASLGGHNGFALVVDATQPYAQHALDVLFDRAGERNDFELYLSINATLLKSGSHSLPDYVSLINNYKSNKAYYKVLSGIPVVSAIDGGDERLNKELEVELKNLLDDVKLTLDCPYCTNTLRTPKSQDCGDTEPFAPKECWTLTDESVKNLLEPQLLGRDISSTTNKRSIWGLFGAKEKRMYPPISQRSTKYQDGTTNPQQFPVDNDDSFESPELGSSEKSGSGDTSNLRSETSADSRFDYSGNPGSDSSGYSKIDSSDNSRTIPSGNLKAGSSDYSGSRSSGDSRSDSSSNSGSRSSGNLETGPFDYTGSSSSGEIKSGSSGNSVSDSSRYSESDYSDKSRSGSSDNSGSDSSRYSGPDSPDNSGMASSKNSGSDSSGNYESNSSGDSDSDSSGYYSSDSPGNSQSDSSEYSELSSPADLRKDAAKARVSAKEAAAQGDMTQAKFYEKKAQEYEAEADDSESSDTGSSDNAPDGTDSEGGSRNGAGSKGSFSDDSHPVATYDYSVTPTFSYTQPPTITDCFTDSGGSCINGKPTSKAADGADGGDAGEEGAVATNTAAQSGAATASTLLLSHIPALPSKSGDENEDSRSTSSSIPQSISSNSISPSSSFSSPPSPSSSVAAPPSSSIKPDDPQKTNSAGDKKDDEGTKDGACKKSGLGSMFRRLIRRKGGKGNSGGGNSSC
jgi:Glycosyl hydrolase family 71